MSSRVDLRALTFTLQDADDISYINRIENQLAAMRKAEEIAAVFIGHDLLVGDTRFAPTFRELDINACKEEINNFRIPGHDALGLYRCSLVGSERYDPELKIGQGIDFVRKRP